MNVLSESFSNKLITVISFSLSIIEQILSYNRIGLSPNSLRKFLSTYLRVRQVLGIMKLKLRENQHRGVTFRNKLLLVFHVMVLIQFYCNLFFRPEDVV